MNALPLFAVALLFAATVPEVDAAMGGYQIITDEHVDLQVEFRGGWGTVIRADSRDVPNDQALLYDGPAGTTAFARPASSQWDFLGVGAGEPIYIFPQGSYDGRIYLGFGSDDGSIPEGTFASYHEPDPRVNNTAAWTKVSLVGLRFTPDPSDTSTAVANFSLWQTGGALGGPASGFSLWMATSDGIDAADATWLYAGGHSHFNWGFSRIGYYQIDLRYSGFLNDGHMTPTESPVYTFHFGVEYLPVAIPEPGASTLLLPAIASLLLRRQRSSFPLE